MIRSGIYDTVHNNYSPDVIADCVALANSLGGYVHIGQGIGVDNPAAAEKNIRAALSELVCPDDLASLVKISSEEIDGNTTMKISIPTHPMALYYIKCLGLEYGVFVRDEAKTMKATPAQVAQLLDRACHIWEEGPFLLKHSQHFQVSFSSFEQYCNENDCKAAKAVLKKEGFLRCEDGHTTNLGFLLSDACTPQILIYDDTAPKTAYHECCGPYFQQIIAAQQQLDGCNTYRSNHKYALPYDYPQHTLTALLYHAVRYRDYSLPGEIVFRIQQDKIEMAYPFSLIPPFKLADYFNGASYPKDPEISKALDILGLEIMHHADFGCISASYASYGIEPEYSITDHVLRIVLPNLNRSDAILAYPQLSNKERAVLDLIFLKYAITRNDVEYELAIPQATAIRTLNSLVEKGLVAKIGSGKSTLYRHLPQTPPPMNPEAEEHGSAQSPR